MQDRFHLGRECTENKRVFTTTENDCIKDSAKWPTVRNRELYTKFHHLFAVKCTLKKVSN